MLRASCLIFVGDPTSLVIFVGFFVFFFPLMIECFHDVFSLSFSLALNKPTLRTILL